jgi:branched-chain amino acid transport system permease protein
MDLLLQLLANGLVAGSSWVMVALGFGLIFRVTATFHLAHGSVYAAAGYLAYALAGEARLPWPLAFAIATAGAGVLGCLIDVGIYRPLRARDASPFVVLVSSIGVAVLLNNFYGLVSSHQVLNLTVAAGPGFSLGPVTLSGVQIATVGFGLGLTAALLVFLARSRTGLGMRAVANSPFMARTVGVPVERVRLLTFAVGSLLAAPAGILTMLDTGARPDMGLAVVLMATIAVFVGGIGSLPGAALAALILGLVVNLGIWQWSARWQDAIAFSVLLAVVVVRPRGLLGIRQRQAEV